MNLYKISRKTGYAWYDEYYGAVVVAESVEDARKTHPDELWPDIQCDVPFAANWTDIDNVKVELLGVAVAGIVPGVVMSDVRGS